MESTHNRFLNGSSQKPLSNDKKNAVQDANCAARLAEAADADTSLHSESIQQIMTRVPSWLVRWGVAIFFLILVIVFAISDFIYLPNFINTKLKIEGDVEKGVVVPVSGVIGELFVKMGDTVKRGQPLLTIRDREHINKICVLYAPETGRITSTAIAFPGYSLNAGQQAFVIHTGNTRMYGIAEVPANRISEIKAGQNVLITLNEHNDLYGQLIGKINHITDEPVNGNFLVSVDLEHYRKNGRVGLKDWMNASAKIVTGNTTILDRLLKGIK